MNTKLIGIVAALAFAAASAPASAGTALNGNGQVQDGEAGYKIGCTVAGALGIPSCGEMPSGKQFMPPEEYGPPAPAPEQYGPQQEPEPGPVPAPSGPQENGDGQ